MPQSDDAVLRLDGATVVVTCHFCGKPVEGDDGVLWVDMHEIRKIEVAWQDFHAARPEGSAMNVTELLDLPGPAEWTAFHKRHKDAVGSYAIQVDRINTVPKLLIWTAHLMNKTWIGHTDWDRVLRSASGLTALQVAD